MYINVLKFFCLDCNKYYNVESGEITSPRYNRWHFERLNCIYRIKVPRGRRITVEVVEGGSIVKTCNRIAQQENVLEEKLVVSVPN